MIKYNIIYMIADKTHRTVIYSTCEESAIDQFWRRYPSAIKLVGVI